MELSSVHNNDKTDILEYLLFFSHKCLLKVANFLEHLSTH